MSASDVVRRFVELDVLSHKSCQALDEFLRSPCYGYFSSTLQGQDIVRYADFLDKTLNWRQPTEKLWASCFIALRQLCGDRAILPTTYVLSRKMIKRGKASGINRSPGHYWEAQYKRKTVHVRSLRVSQASDQTIKKFCHEAVLWKRLDHPNVAAVLGVTTDPCQIVFDKISDKDVMQCTLNKDVDRGSLVSDIAEGLAYLHLKKVVHGRIRGGIILVNDEGRAMLTDFGSCSVAWNLGDVSQIIRWCAPEVLGNVENPGTAPTYASDAFSFGMVALEVLSGKVPFDGVPDGEVVKRVRSGERPDRSTGLGVSDTQWEMICKCWNGTPELRPGMADVLSYTRRTQPIGATGYSKVPDLLNPDTRPDRSRWKRFKNSLFGLW